MDQLIELESEKVNLMKKLIDSLNKWFIFYWLFFHDLFNQVVVDGTEAGKDGT